MISGDYKDVRCSYDPWGSFTGCSCVDKISGKVISGTFKESVYEDEMECGRVIAADVGEVIETKCQQQRNALLKLIEEGRIADAIPVECEGNGM